MKRLFFVGFILVGIFSLMGCGGTREATTRETKSELDELMELMSGTFSSEAQASRDTGYYHIILHMYPIWEHRGNWLYVEQAMAGREDQPYRQRIYHLEQVAKGTFRSVVYILPDPEAFVGAWQDIGRFKELNPLQLEIRNGCDVYLEKTGRGRFVGSTRGTSCASELAGATFATSEVRIKSGTIESWDRGFDEQGSQVWGATGGGYIFKRK